MIRSKTTIAIPPGETIREQFEMLGMARSDFATRMGLSDQDLASLLSGEASLGEEIARRLETVLGIKASFWNELERIYREKIIRINKENALEAKDPDLGALGGNFSFLSGQPAMVGTKQYMAELARP